MNIELHKKVLGTFYIVFGILHILFSLMGYYLLWRIIDFADVPDEVYDIVRIAGMWIGYFIIITSFLAIIGGAGMLNGKRWSKILLLALGCIFLFLLPIGTILGIYTIVVFLSDKEETMHSRT